MPTVSIERDILFDHLGRKYTDEEFDELCFEFGIELDEITSERDEVMKQQQSQSQSSQTTASKGGGKEELLSDNVIYKIDVPANRYDLLCVEGLSRALKIFLNDMDTPTYQRLEPTTSSSTTTTMTVRKKNTDTIRPYVVCAILRDVTFTEHIYQSFLDLQDQLHRNLCRGRTLVAIGTHDLDSIHGPFIYDAKNPTDIEFVPLAPNDRGIVNAQELIEIYETDVSVKHLKPYVPIIKDSELYPVITDSNGIVLSLPPIINGNVSKITLNTKNVYIECTATDLTKANIVLDTMVTMFCEYCAQPYTIESVQVQYIDEEENVVESYITPSLSTRKERASVEFCNSLIGINLLPHDMKTLCNKVQLGPAELLDNDTILEVNVPPTRSDILHPVDIAEDIGIAYGYNNIRKRIPTTSTVGGEFILNQITDLLRDEISRAGYIEVLTHGLCSLADNYTSLRRPINIPTATTTTTTSNDETSTEVTTTITAEMGHAVSLSNPANIEYQVVRTTLLPGLLKTLQHNKSASFSGGYKLFEISDVVVIDTEHVVMETIVGAKNIRRICAIYSGPTSGFEVIHGLVDRIMTLLEIAPHPDYIATTKSDEEKFRVVRDGYYYNIQPIISSSSNSNTTATTNQSIVQSFHEAAAGTYFPGRAASIVLTTPTTSTKPVIVGTFGILHPEVLSNFDIQYPASCVEIDLEVLM